MEYIYIAIVISYLGLALAQLGSSFTQAYSRRLPSIVLGGAAAAISLVEASRSGLFEPLQAVIHNVISMLFSAHAQTKEKVSVMDPFLLGLVFDAIVVAFLITFVASVYIVLTTDNTPQTKSRVEAADGLVKMLSGFFIGLLTSMIKQTLG